MLPIKLNIAVIKSINILVLYSNSEAKEVCLKIFGEYNPLLEGEYDEKFPVSSLRAGKSVTLFVADEMGAPNNYKVEVSWVDPDGSNQNDVQTIYLK